MAEDDWTRVAQYVEARMSELRLNRTALAREAQVDRKTIDNFLDRGMKPRADRRGGWETALRWRFGSMNAIAKGGEPTLTETNSQPEPEVDRRSVAELVEAGEAPLLSVDPEALRGLSEEDQATVIREAQEHALRVARLLRGDR